MDSNENIILNNNNNKINDSEEENKYKILNRNELIKFILTETQNLPKQNNYHIIGFIGYPNIGKSSIINVLMKSKKVAVAILPKKNKTLSNIIFTSRFFIKYLRKLYMFNGLSWISFSIFYRFDSQIYSSTSEDSKKFEKLIGKIINLSLIINYFLKIGSFLKIINYFFKIVK